MNKSRTAKRIEQMSYGSPAQLQAAAEWHARFVRFAEEHPVLAETVWHRLFTQDVWYTARRNAMFA